MTQRGVGYSWTELNARSQPIFAAGGHLDGGFFSTAPDGDGKDKQAEEAMTIDKGYSERALDVPIVRAPVEKVANTSDEFAHRTNKMDSEGRVELSVVRDGLAGGDTSVKSNPNSTYFNQTDPASGGFTKQYSATVDGNDGTAKSVGENPFTTRVHIDTIDEFGRHFLAPTQESVYKTDDNDDDSERVSTINAKTGLRRTNIRQNKSRLQERVDSHQSRMEAINKLTEQSDSIANLYYKPPDTNVVNEHHRFEGADMLASQFGLTDLSNEQARKYARSKQVGKLASAYVL